MRKQRKISMSLDPQSIGKAISKLREYQKWFSEKTSELTERLATIGGSVASRDFATAMYDGENDVRVTVEPLRGNAGWAIKANGKATLFIEFGSGSYHNSGEPHPNRPAGVAGIGKYGHGLGKRHGWVFRNVSGDWQFTRGNPASMPMHNAQQAIMEKIYDIAKEVLG